MKHTRLQLIRQLYQFNLTPKQVADGAVQWRTDMESKAKSADDLVAKMLSDNKSEQIRRDAMVQAALARAARAKHLKNC